MNLTANFSLHELTKSETALRMGFDNTPGEKEIAALKLLAEKVLQPVRDHFGKGVKCNSGFRSPESNAAVGGSRTSDHCLGRAADIEIPGVPNAELAQWIMDNLEYTQLILEFYTPGIPDSGWVHVSYDPNNLKKQELTAMKVGLNLAGYNLLALGTNLKYYIQNGTNGNSYDVTPLRFTTGAGEATFAATTGSPIITVTDIAHGAQAGDFVTYSGAVSLGGNITATILNAEFQITAYVSSNQYTITASVNATAGDSGNGGSSVVAAYQITTGTDIYAQNVGWGAGTWGGIVFGTATNQLNGAINDSVTTITVDDTTAFTAAGNILIGSENISYTSKNSTQFLGCTRGLSGAGSGAAASHADNTTVTQSTTFTGWGSPAATGIGIQLRLWSQSNFGEDLIFNPRGGALYYWANAASASTFNRGQYLGPSTAIVTKSGTITTDAYCPTVANFVTVSDASRFVLVFGCNDYGSTVQDPLLIRWSDQESFALWYPAVTNQAGSYRLSHGSNIVTAMQTRQEILVLTDSAIYSMQYLGPPYVWSFQILGDNISIAGPNAIATANNITYWMGTDKFYMYSGRVQTLPSTLREYVYNDINLEQSYQFCAGTNEGYSEVWWQYCSAGSTVVDRYVIYNHLENTWYYGDWDNYQNVNQGRTAWLDSSLRSFPMATTYGVAGGDSNTQLVYHENGVDDGTVNPSVPIVAQVTSSDFDIGDGHNFGFVWRLIPDLTFDGSNVNQPTAMFTVLPRANSGAPYGNSNNPEVVSTQNYQNTRTYAIQEFTQQVYVRIRGRQMAFKVSSNELGVQWQLGVPRIDIRPDGRR
jgi:zinc D-Ala-D-Ala carboxypeptidase